MKKYDSQIPAIDHEYSQKKYYNEIAKWYDSYYSNDYSLQLRYDIYDVLLSGTLSRLKNIRVLDSMCGGGQNTIYFKRYGALVEGCDISEEQCLIYSKRHPDCTVCCCSITCSNYEDKSFDVVVCDSLHHVFPETNRCLDEFYRVLKSNGLLILWEPTSGSILNVFRKLWQKMDSKLFQDNEMSIDIHEILNYYGPKMNTIKIIHGGNVGYIFVFGSMVLRIPHNILKFYAPLLIKMENLINRFQPRYLSLYVAALLKKKA